MRSNRQRGAGNFGCFVSLLVLAIAIVLAVKIIPKKIAVGELTDYCRRQLEAASTAGMTDQVITNNVLRKAGELKLPVGPESVKVWRGGGEVHIEVKYTVVIDLLVTKHNWKVEVAEDRPLF